MTQPHGLRLASALCGLLASLMPGCAKRKITPEELPGTWEATSTSLLRLPNESRPLHPVLALHAGGQVEARDVPYGLADPLRREKDVASRASGRWSLEDDGYGRPIIRVVFREVDGRTANQYNQLWVERSGAGFRAGFYFGDPDSGERFVYERRP
jgi:hypothetical protein